MRNDHLNISIFVHEMHIGLYQQLNGRVFWLTLEHVS